MVATTSPSRAELLSLLECATTADDLAWVESHLELLEPVVQEPEQSAGDRLLSSSAKWKQRARRDAQDIGMPYVGSLDEERKRQSHESLEYHLKTYYPETFTLDFCKDHKRLIGMIQQTLEDGGQKAIALMRGGAKSSILLRAVLWAVLTKRRRFVCLVSATSKTAKKLLATLKKIIRTNSRLQADYESLHCLVSLGGRNGLADGQHINGQSTNVVLGTDLIASGYIEGVNDEEWVISSYSILSGDLRGQSHTTTNGENIRPDAVLIDDPQTKASARSKPSCKNRLEIINGDILKMGGNDRQIACLAAVTIIRKNDLADRLVSRSKNKHWRGEKIPCVKRFPDNMDLWAEWEELYDSELDLDSPHDKSQEFVVENYAAMHEGSDLFWATNYDRKQEVSALHGAMIKRAQDLQAFNAECQLDPTEGGNESQLFELDAQEIALRITPAKRLEVPEGVEVLTSFMDVQDDFLPYAVMGWTLGGRGYVLDYGTWPAQDSRYFTKQTLTQTLADLYTGMSKADCIAVALEEFGDELLSREFYGGERVFSIGKQGIDVGYKLYAQVVRDYCRTSIHRARLHPQQGKGYNALSQVNKRVKGGKLRKSAGINCSYRKPPDGKRGRDELWVDVNYWKTTVAEGLTVPTAASNAIVLFDDTPENHLLFGESCECEQPVQKKNKDGDQHVVWEDRTTGQSMNDFWDCLVGNAAIASTLGVFERNKPKATASKGSGESQFMKEFRQRNATGFRQ